jgi:hypothetical protein
MAARGSLHAAEPAACLVETYLPFQGAIRLAAADPVDAGVVGSTGFSADLLDTHRLVLACSARTAAFLLRGQPYLF